MKKLRKLNRKVINYEKSEPDEEEIREEAKDITKNQIILTLIIFLGIAVSLSAYYHNRLAIAESQGRNATQGYVQTRDKLIKDCGE